MLKLFLNSLYTQIRFYVLKLLENRQLENVLKRQNKDGGKICN